MRLSRSPCSMMTSLSCSQRRSRWAMEVSSFSRRSLVSASVMDEIFRRLTLAQALLGRFKEHLMRFGENGWNPLREGAVPQCFLQIDTATRPDAPPSFRIIADKPKNREWTPMNANSCADRAACANKLFHLRGVGCRSQNSFTISVHSRFNCTILASDAVRFLSEWCRPGTPASSKRSDSFQSVAKPS
jgi:hypothetical protein